MFCEPFGAPAAHLGFLELVRGQRRDVAFHVALRVDLLEALGAALVLDRLPRAGRAVRRAAARERFAGFCGGEILEADDALAVFVEFVRHRCFSGPRGVCYLFAHCGGWF